MNNPPGQGHPSYKHGKSYHRVYQVWQNMWQRCENKKCPEYKRYGARGIKVCQRWRVFEDFYVDVGDPPPGKSFDRKDNDGNYEPSNCHWATPMQQGLNRRNTVRLTLNGKTQSMNSWIKERGLSYTTIVKRMRLGMSPEDILRKGRLTRASS